MHCELVLHISIKQIADFWNVPVHKLMVQFQLLDLHVLRNQVFVQLQPVHLYNG